MVFAVEFFPKHADPHNEAVRSSVSAQQTGVFERPGGDSSVSFDGPLNKYPQQYYWLNNAVKGFLSGQDRCAVGDTLGLTRVCVLPPLPGRRDLETVGPALPVSDWLAQG